MYIQAMLQLIMSIIMLLDFFFFLQSMLEPNWFEEIQLVLLNLVFTLKTVGSSS